MQIAQRDDDIAVPSGELRGLAFVLTRERLLITGPFGLTVLDQHVSGNIGVNLMPALGLCQRRLIPFPYEFHGAIRIIGIERIDRHDETALVSHILTLRRDEWAYR